MKKIILSILILLSLTHIANARTLEDESYGLGYIIKNFLKLDQTTPQTVSNGKPVFSGGIQTSGTGLTVTDGTVIGLFDIETNEIFFACENTDFNLAVGRGNQGAHPQGYDLDLTAGGGNIVLGGAGGHVNIYGGSAYTSGIGGNVTLAGGSGAGGSAAGSVIITGKVDWDGITGNIDIGSNNLVTTGTLGAGATTVTSLKILEGGATPTKYSTFQGGDQTVDITYTLPTAVGAAGTFLKDAAGDGVLSWAAGGSGAPTDATYWTSSANGTLSAEVNLGALTTGLLKHTVAAGVSTPATATAGTDYYNPGGTDVAVADGGTNLSVYAVGDILYASGTTTIGKLADVATGSYLASGGLNTAPAWATLNQAAVAGLTTASSPTFAGLTLSGNYNVGENGIALDPAISADGKYSGITETGTAGATLAFGDLIYFQAVDSRWELVDANLSAGYDKKLGICVLAAANDGTATTILLWGKVNAATAFPTLTIGSPVYMSETAGDVVVAQPTTADVCIRIIGFANTADELYFCPSNDYMTHT